MQNQSPCGSCWAARCLAWRRSCSINGESLAASVGWATHGVGSPVQLAGFSPLLVQFEIEWALSSGKIVFLSERLLFATPQVQVAVVA